MKGLDPRSGPSTNSTNPTNSATPLSPVAPVAPVAPVSQAWLQRYLSQLGVERERPGREALARLVRAQGMSNVFENVTAILRRVRAGDGPVPPVDLEALLSARADGRGGGVCFELAPLFRQLLVGLGYQVHPILAQISFPGSHHASVVDLRDVDGARYLVDVGSGAPLWQPFKIGETVELWHTGLGYRLRPAAAAEAGAAGAAGDALYVQERWNDDGWQVACRYDLRPAEDAVRAAVYQRHQLAGETWVVGNLTLVRCTAGAVHRLRDDEMVTYTAGGKQVERIDTRAAYRRVAADVFGLPGLPIEDALTALEDIKRRRAGATHAP